MSLNFKSGKLQGGEFEQCWLEEWSWSKSGGSYFKGRNFLDIHWEVQLKSSSCVRLHVEAPKYGVDRVLNTIKLEIINSILECREIQKTVMYKKFIYKRGSRISEEQVRNNQSTEVFHVEFNRSGNSKEKMMVVHKLLSALVDSKIAVFRRLLKAIFSE